MCPCTVDGTGKPVIAPAGETPIISIYYGHCRRGNRSVGENRETGSRSRFNGDRPEVAALVEKFHTVVAIAHYLPDPWPINRGGEGGAVCERTDRSERRDHVGDVIGDFTDDEVAPGPVT